MNGGRETKRITNVLCMKQISRAIFLATAAFTPSVPSLAEDVFIEQTLDLTNPGTDFHSSAVNSMSGAGFSPGVSQAIAVGDTFHLIYDFGDRRITADDISGVWINIQLGLPVDFSQFAAVRTTGTVSFLGASGQLIYTSPLETNLECCLQVGQSFNLSTGPLTFYGVRYDGALEAYYAYIDSRTYSLPSLSISGSGFTLSYVPEPSTWAFFILGFGAVGYLLRRNSSRQVKSAVT